jgi:hypothetical protein
MHVKFVFCWRTFILKCVKTLFVDHDAAVGARTATSTREVCVLPCDKLSVLSLGLSKERLCILLLDEFWPSLVPFRVLLHRPINSREQVGGVLGLEADSCLDVESILHVFPRCVVAVCASVDDESPFRLWACTEFCLYGVKVRGHCCRGLVCRNQRLEVPRHTDIGLCNLAPGVVEHRAA